MLKANEYFLGFAAEDILLHLVRVSKIKLSVINDFKKEVTQKTIVMIKTCWDKALCALLLSGMHMSSTQP